MSVAGAAHRLVVLGDSLSHGFQSFAIYNTGISYPALIAASMRLTPDQFRYPTYTPTAGPDYKGPALNLELMCRRSGEPDCSATSLPEQLELGVKAFALLVEIHRYWDSDDRIRELGLDQLADSPPIMHNLAVSGFDVRDVFERTAETDIPLLRAWAEFTDLGPIATNARALISLPVLKTARRSGRYMSTVEAAQTLGAEGGVETLIVFIGANNALGTVISMEIRETDTGYDSLTEKSKYNLWKPAHFQDELDILVTEVKKVKAEHVIWATVPHVTVAPLAHGIKGRMAATPEYFNYYTYPWIPEERFHPFFDPHLTGKDVAHIDGYIDQYNDSIRRAVEGANEPGQTWHVVDVCALMDSVAYRRYWDPAEPRLKDARRRKQIPDKGGYEAVLPDALRRVTARGKIGGSAGDPVLPPDSRFFSSQAGRRTQGGLVALDGVHPTTVGYGILADAFLKVMQAAGVEVGDGEIDFERLVGLDSLVGNPPDCVAPTLKGLGSGEVGFDWVNGFAKTFNRPRRRHNVLFRKSDTSVE